MPSCSPSKSWKNKRRTGQRSIDTVRLLVASGLVYLRARYYEPGEGRFTTKDVWAGDAMRPMSFNQWAYAFANPVRFTDPSGLITQAEAPDAEMILDYLLNVYSVQIFRDWGDSGANPSLPIELSLCSSQWVEGQWHSLNELDWTRQAILDVSMKLGGAWKFKSAMKNRPVTIGRVSWSRPGGLAPPFVGRLVRDLILTDNTFTSKDFAKFVVVHEIGHVWDWRTRGSLHAGLSLAVGTQSCEMDWFSGQEACRFRITAGKEEPPGRVSNPYAGTAAWEDWAESFASYVYPDFFNKPGYRILGPLRRNYVENQIKNIP